MTSATSRTIPATTEQSHEREAESEFDLVAPDSLLAQAAGLWTFIPANGAAFILQAMHPTIGDIVQQYSVYQTDPWGRTIRSFDSVLLWVYGGQAAIEEGYRLRRLHRPLRTTTADGKHVSALNPEAYGWVIGTAFVSAVWSWPLMFGRPLTEDEEEQVYADIQRVARIVQVPESQIPPSREAYWRYYHEMVSSRLVNHPVAQDIVGNQFTSAPPPPPGMPRLLRPLWKPVGSLVAHVLYLLTLGPMSPEIRAKLEVDWTPRDERRAKALYALLRHTFRLLPARVKYAPLAYHALAQHRSLGGIRHRARASFA